MLFEVESREERDRQTRWGSQHKRHSTLPPNLSAHVLLRGGVHVSDRPHQEPPHAFALHTIVHFQSYPSIEQPSSVQHAVSLQDIARGEAVTSGDAIARGAG